MRGQRLVSVGLWLLLAAVAAVIAARTRYTADLSAFLPTAPTHAQQFLVEQLRDGLASRLIMVDIEGADQTVRAQLSRAVAARLRAQPSFRSVLNGAASGFDNDRAFVLEHRYLLSENVTPQRFEAAGLAAALGEGVDLLSSPMGLLAKDLFARDPTGETLQTLAQFDQAATAPNSLDGVWASRDGRRALLVAETRAAGSDADGQLQAIAAIRRAFAESQREGGVAAAQALLQLTGPGVFAAEARTTIEREAVRLSIISAALIAALLLLVFRSPTMLLASLLPVFSGALAGVVAVSLGFGVVHGVTLGFGVTLIGEAVDYSIYLFIQPRPVAGGGVDRDEWTRLLWPTIRLGMLTSICGFASLLPSAFPGLAQLGLYSIAGLVVAGLVTRFVLPQLLPRDFRSASVLPLGRAVERALVPLRALRGLLWLLPLSAAVVLYLHRDRLWNRELAALSPVSAAAQQLDGELRTDVGAPDVSTIIVLAGDDEQAVLRAAEALSGPLDALSARGVIAGYQSPGRYLPSLATQQARRAALPATAELKQRLLAAEKLLPIRVDRLQPFLDDVEAARQAPLIRRADLESTTLQAGYDALLVRQGSQWHALLPLQAPGTAAGAATIDADAVARSILAVATPGVEATVLNLKRESDALYSGYLSEAMRLSLLGFAAIVLLLLVTLRSVRRVARVVVPLVLAVLAVLLGFALAGRALNILHLIGLLLVMAIGSNYALFFDRETSTADVDASARTLASLVVANLTTVMAFGVLSFSSVPVLSALGSTVAPGALLALLFAAACARRPPQAGSR